MNLKLNVIIAIAIMCVHGSNVADNTELDKKQLQFNHLVGEEILAAHMVATQTTERQRRKADSLENQIQPLQAQKQKNKEEMQTNALVAGLLGATFNCVTFQHDGRVTLPILNECFDQSQRVLELASASQDIKEQARATTKQKIDQAYHKHVHLIQQVQEAQETSDKKENENEKLESTETK